MALVILILFGVGLIAIGSQFIVGCVEIAKVILPPAIIIFGILFIIYYCKHA